MKYLVGARVAFETECEVDAQDAPIAFVELEKRIRTDEQVLQLIQRYAGENLSIIFTSVKETK